MKSDDTAAPNIPEVKTISPPSTPRGMKILYFSEDSIFSPFFSVFKYVIIVIRYKLLKVIKHITYCFPNMSMTFANQIQFSGIKSIMVEKFIKIQMNIARNDNILILK